MPKVRSQDRRRSTEKAGSYTVPGQSLNPSGGCEVPRGNEGPGDVGCSEDEEERWIRNRCTKPSISWWNPTTTSARYKPACAIYRMLVNLLWRRASSRA